MTFDGNTPLRELLFAFHAPNSPEECDAALDELSRRSVQSWKYEQVKRWLIDSAIVNKQFVSIAGAWLPHEGTPEGIDRCINQLVESFSNAGVIAPAAPSAKGGDA